MSRHGRRNAADHACLTLERSGESVHSKVLVMIYRDLERLRALLWKAEARPGEGRRDVELAQERIKQAKDRLTRATCDRAAAP